jgi:hypothetical protein
MIFVYIAIIIVVTWTIATYYVEQEGPIVFDDNSMSNEGRQALIVYDPDPVVHQDAEICQLISKGLLEANWNTTLASVQGIEDVGLDRYDLFVICANAYNFGPDRIVKNFISGGSFLKNKHVAVLAVGKLGHTKAQKELEKLVLSEGGILLDSQALESILTSKQESNKIGQKATTIVRNWALRQNEFFYKI